MDDEEIARGIKTLNYDCNLYTKEKQYARECVRAGRLAERASTRSMLEALRGELAGPATSVSFLAAEDNEGDAVRWSDVERIFDTRIAELGGEDGHRS